MLGQDPTPTLDKGCRSYGFRRFHAGWSAGVVAKMDLSTGALAKVDAVAQAPERTVPSDTNDRAGDAELLGDLR